MAADPARLKRALLAWLACGVLVAGCTPPAGEPRSAEGGAATADPRRVVSIVPATTEIVFALGAGDRVVGVGSYDRFPPEVERIRRVGGLVDPDTEAILSLRPDLVILYQTQVELMARLDRAGIPYFAYEHRTLADVMDTVRALGERLGLEAEGRRVAAGMERDLARVEASVAARPRPDTLLVFGREPGALRNIHASGGYGFLADLVRLAGGANVFGEVERQSVLASTEMILARKPEVIVELRYGRAADHDEDAARSDWAMLPALPAVRRQRVHVLTGDEFVVPGPRVVLAAERLAQALHPR